MSAWARSIIALGWSLGLLGLLGCGGPSPSAKVTGTWLEPPKAMPSDLPALTDSQGEAVSLRDFRGQWVLVFFGYTHCPDVCPLTLMKWRKVREGFSEAEARRVRFVFVTVDPERDTPERLRAYLPQFHPEFLGLTGPPERLSPYYQAFGVHASPASHEKEQGAEHGPQAGTTGEIVHSGGVYLLNPRGELQVLYGSEFKPEDLLHDLRLLLR